MSGTAVPFRTECRRDSIAVTTGFHADDRSWISGPRSGRAGRVRPVIAVWIVLAVVAVLVVSFVFGFNHLVRLRNEANTGWSNIDVQLKRRADLIPNLVEAVKGYAAHERGVFDEVTQARAGAIAAGAQGPQQRAAAEDMLTGALRSLFAVAEAYPQLQAVQEFKHLS